MAPHDWRTSSYSTSNGGDCVETRRLTGWHQVRDTKNRDAGMLTVSPGAWRTFVGAVMAERI